MPDSHSVLNRILFVCTGNVCRSPMAAALFSNRLPDDAGYIVESAGTHGLDGRPAASMAVELMRERGVDLSRHRARTVTPGLLNTFDLIWTMERAQQKWIQQRMPSIQGRIRTLGRGRNPNIPDPMGGSRADFSRVLTDIETGLAPWLTRFPASATSLPTEQHESA